ncbi:MAG: hypothetical protein MOB07_24625 [Acidobacteria bacterium]|nr:hypothetical protein [Acidobacteriota bacterium]
MEKDNRPERSKNTPPSGKIKDALKQAPDQDLLEEVLRRGLTTEARPGTEQDNTKAADEARQQVNNDIGEAIASIRAAMSFLDILRRRHRQPNSQPPITKS